MSVITVSVEGASALGERMRLLASAVSLRISKQAVGAGAKVVQKAIIAKAPAYDKTHVVEKGGEKVTVQPGNLKKNIITKRLTKSSLTAEYAVLVRNDRKSGFAARYGRLVEYGTVNFAANSYFRSGWESSKQAALSRIIEKLGQGIDKEAKKL